MSFTTVMDENGDSLSSFFNSALPLDESSNDRLPTSLEESRVCQLSSPSKMSSPFYGQYLGSFVSPFAMSNADGLSPNPSQMSFSLVSPYPISPENPMSSSNSQLFPRGNNLSLQFPANVFSPPPNSTDLSLFQRINIYDNQNVPQASHAGSVMKAEKLQNIINNGKGTGQRGGDLFNSLNSENETAVIGVNALLSSADKDSRNKRKSGLDLHFQEDTDIKNQALNRSSQSSPSTSEISSSVRMFKDSSPRRPNKCNCKKSKCLKLYCECFQALRYCDSCNCTDCLNTVKHTDLRIEAIKQAKEKNHTAFQVKIVDEGHANGCHCKQSKCLKKYCECFHASTFCGTNCKCKSCANFEGSKDLVKVHIANADKQKTNLFPTTQSATTTTTTTTEGEKKRKESPISVSNITDVLSPSPFQSTAIVSTPATSILPLKPVSHTSDSVTACVNGIASLPRSSRRKTTNQVDSKSVTTAITTRSTSKPTDHSTSNRISPYHEGSVNYGTLSSFTPLNTMPLNFRHLGSGSQPLKKRKVKGNNTPIVYPFFGTNNPPVPKVIALRCLEFLCGRDFYSLSVVSSLWNAAAKDDALWESV